MRRGCGAPGNSRTTCSGAAARPPAGDGRPVTYPHGLATAGLAYGVCLSSWRGGPITSVLIATILLFSDGLAVMPLVIVAVVVAYVAAARLTPAAAPGSETAAPAEAGSAAATGPAAAAGTTST